MSNKSTSRIKEDIGYILHSLPWKETSLIVKVFLRNYGCMVMVAKGAKRPYSQIRSVLSKFTPLVIRWSGKSEIKTLVKADLEGIILLPGKLLMYAWYLNDLVISFLPKEDPHPKLFDIYDKSLNMLTKCNDNNTIKNVVRRFEWILLKEIGYGIDFEEPDFNNIESNTFISKIIGERIETNLYGKCLRTKKVFKDL